MHNIAYFTKDWSKWYASIEVGPGGARFWHTFKDDPNNRHADAEIQYWHHSVALNERQLWRARVNAQECVFEHFPDAEPNRVHKDTKIAYLDWNGDLVIAELDIAAMGGANAVRNALSPVGRFIAMLILKELIKMSPHDRIREHDRIRREGWPGPNARDGVDYDRNYDKVKNIA